MKNDKDAYISRVEHRSGNSGFYWVRFCSGSKENATFKHEKQKTFTDLQCGGKRAALKKARQWRDKTMVSLNKSYHSHKHQIGMRRKKARSNTNIVGVSRIEYDKYNSRYGTYRRVAYFFFFFCCWVDGKRKAKYKCFYFDWTDPQDEKRALKLAKAFRKEMESIHYIN